MLTAAAAPEHAAASEGVMTGTTIMAVSFDGGVILGADSRTSTGTYVANRASDKITELAENVYCCRSGSAADTQAVTDIVRRHITEHKLLKGSNPTVKATAHLVGSVCYSNKDRLMAGMICAGWDAVDGGSVYAVPLGGACVKVPFAIGGSGSTYIYGHVDATFRRGMTRDECMEFVRNAVSHAMARDGSSGGCIRMVVITRDSVERLFIPGDRLPFSLP